MPEAAATSADENQILDSSASLIDTHCHLDPHYFPSGPDEVLARAQAARVRGFVVVGVGRDLAPARAAVGLAKRLPARIGAAVGVHPHDAVTLDDAAHAELEQLAKEPEVVAVGEIGLDYHYDHSPRDTQREVFARLVHLARAVKKPIVVHTRSAAADTLEILEREGARDVGGVIHCFSEDRAFAARALDLGFDISFSGIVTFKSSAAIQDVAQWAPLDRILVETDSPYLAPVPLRGKPCEPAYVVHTARRVAALRNMPFAALCEATSANAERRFGRAFGPLSHA
ncbi:MAG TPA: TatD family hydrolase [Labilithrix sp.]|nr:TatD family hydrolase [Labilithrix sp.]